MSGAGEPRKPTGLRTLNVPPDAPPPQGATILVSGPPRSGTSFVAAALHAAGLPLGELIDHTVFEDIELAAALDARWRVTRQIDWPALRPFDSARLRGIVRARDAAFPRWGFKRPDLPLPLLGRSGAAMFRHPRAVMIFRDPAALAERIAMAEGLDLREALRAARRHNDAGLRAARHATIPVLLASYEKARAKPETFFAALYDFCGLDVPTGAYPAISAFVADAGRSYLAMAAAPISGFINRYSQGVLYGWCRVAGRKGPETVEIYADDRLVATVRADIFRPVLRQAGIGRGHHGFAAPLGDLGLAPQARITARVAGGGPQMANGGRTLAELTTAG